MKASPAEERRKLNAIAKRISQKYLERIDQQHNTHGILDEPPLGYWQINPEAEKRIQADLSIIPPLTFANIKNYFSKNPQQMGTFINFDPYNIMPTHSMFQRNMFMIEYNYLVSVLFYVVCVSKNDEALIPSKPELVKAGVSFGKSLASAYQQISDAIQTLDDVRVRNYIYDIFSDAFNKAIGSKIKLGHQIFNRLPGYQMAAREMMDESSSLYEAYDGRKLRGKLSDLASLALAKSFTLCFGRLPTGSLSGKNEFTQFYTYLVEYPYVLRKGRKNLLFPPLAENARELQIKQAVKGAKDWLREQYDR